MSEPELVSSKLCEEKHKSILRVVEINSREIRSNSDDIKELIKISIRLATIIEVEKKKQEPKLDFWNTKSGIFLLRSIVVLFISLFGLATGLNIMSLL